MKFEANLPHCVRNVKEKNVLLFKFRCNIFIGVRNIKEMPGSVANGTPCVKLRYPSLKILYPITVYAVCIQLGTNTHLV
jgi:hypothetical protein